MRRGPFFLVSRRLEEMGSFYEEIVGLRASSREPDHHVWFSADGLDLAIHAPENDPGPDFTPRPQGVLMWFEAARGLSEIATQLRERGADVWGPFDGGVRDLLYTLDPDGNMVGLFVTKSQTAATLPLTHALGAASVIVDGTRRVLLVRHTYGKKNWEIPGGLANVGESAEETARREAREEIAVELLIGKLTGVYWEPAWGGVGGHHFVFLARLASSAEPRPADVSEIADVGWFAPDALPRPISDFTVRRIGDALADRVALVHEVGPRMWLE